MSVIYLKRNGRSGRWERHGETFEDDEVVILIAVMI